MKEHPILFSTAMVRAILEGRKTQTRRLAKAPPHLLKKEPECFRPPYAPGDLLWVRETWCEGPRGYLYRASSNQTKIRWRPSIHMPRKACRLFLEVDDVGIHPLQDISEKDAKAEGVKAYHGLTFITPYLAGFHLLWDELYSTKHTWWWANPWVWAIKFRVLKDKNPIQDKIL